MCIVILNLKQLFAHISVRTERAQKERHKRESERERGDYSLYPVLHLSL